MSNNDLDKVIPVDNPLEPEKGGYLKAYKEHYEPAYGSNSRVFNEETGKLDPLPYNMGLKEARPKLSLETGIQYNLSKYDINSISFNDSINDPRVISISTLKQLGVNYHRSEDYLNEVAERLTHAREYDLFPRPDFEGAKESDIPSIEKVSYQNILRNCDLSKSSYFKAFASEGALIGVGSIDDRDFVNALDNAAKAVAPKLSFDDAKYEKQFDKLEQYLNTIQIRLNHDEYFIDNDKHQELFNISNQGKAFEILRNEIDPALKEKIKEPWLDLNKSPFMEFSTSYRHGYIYDRVIFPAPSNFKSENDYLRAGAHVITNALIDVGVRRSFFGTFENPLELNNHSDYALLSPLPRDSDFDENNRLIYSKELTKAFLTRDIAGTMFAAQFGVPVTQNDINRFNVYFKDKNFPESDVKQIFDVASRVVSFATSKDLSDIGKDINRSGYDIRHPAIPPYINLSDYDIPPKNQGLWANWKADNERYAMQMATPSIPQICKQYNVEMTRDNVITALNNLTSQKFNEVAQSKEPIKAALSQDQSINKALMTKSISVSTDKSKEPQTKGAER